MANTRGNLEAAKIYKVKEGPDSGSSVSCMFNPYEYTIRKSNTFKENPALTLQNPVAEIYQTGAQSLSLKLYFDTYESGEKLTQTTEKLWKFMEPGEQDNSLSKNYPPEVAFHWGPFKFEAYITDMSQKFTLFNKDGIPVRAEVDVTFTQYKEALDFQNPTSGGGPIQRMHRVVSGDRLDRIAYQEYGDAARWRQIAQENGIVNPTALRPGQMLRIPEH